MTLSDAGTAAYLERRRGIVRIPANELLHLLEVPDDVGVVTLSTDWRTDTVSVMVSAPTLDPVDEAAEPPVVSLADLGGRLRLPPAQHPELAARLEAAELVVSALAAEAAEASGYPITGGGDPIVATLHDVRRALADARTALIPQEPTA